MNYQHPCIKCQTTYDSNEDEAYYCPTCFAEKREIAAKVDEKVGIRISNKKTVQSALQHYDSLPKRNGFVMAKDFL